MQKPQSRLDDKHLQNSVVYLPTPPVVNASLKDNPPSYEEATKGSTENHLAKADYGIHTNQDLKGQQVLPITQGFPCNEEAVEFRQDPVKFKCKSCFTYEDTRVEQKINSEGWVWCILCFCCGIWLLSLLVKCMDGFREWHHYCQGCKKKVATYSPSFTAGSITFLILLAILTVTVIGMTIYLRLLDVHKLNFKM